MLPCLIHRSSNIIVGLLTFKLLFQKNGPDWERISKMSIDILEKFQPKDFALEEIEDIICALGQAHDMFSRIFRMRIYEFFLPNIMYIFVLIFSNAQKCCWKNS